MKFKTNIKCASCVATVTEPLNSVVGEGKWSVDLINPMRLLSVDGNPNEEKLKEELEKVGYKVERISE